MKKLFVISIALELLCFAVVHGPLRPFVAVVSGQSVGGAPEQLCGWLVVLCQMLSWVAIPVMIIACILHMLVRAAQLAAVRTRTTPTARAK